MLSCSVRDERTRHDGPFERLCRLLLDLGAVVGIEPSLGFTLD